jgi:hypothetical protein
MPPLDNNAYMVLLSSDTAINLTVEGIVYVVQVELPIGEEYAIDPENPHKLVEVYRMYRILSGNVPAVKVTPPFVE